jgi:hypothetical protein
MINKMTFFNKKEEVLDIQLTQFGKQLLSAGKFKPMYYSFFDSSILYDGEAAGITEVQNDIEGRIQEETPKNKTQHVFSSIENNFSRYLDQAEDITLSEVDKIRIQSTPEREFSLINPLGNSDLGSNVAPSWRVTFLEGDLKSSSYFLTGTYQTLDIPQLNVDFVYVTHVLDSEKSIETAAADWVPGERGPPGQDSVVFNDGSTVSISIENGERDLLLLIEENGVDVDKDNFDIEVFYIEPSDKSYTPLHFVERKSNVVDGLMISGDRPETLITKIDKTYVEFFFDLLVDSKIGERTICESIKQAKSRGIYVDSQLDCGDDERPFSVSPYKDTANAVCKDE